MRTRTIETELRARVVWLLAGLVPLTAALPGCFEDEDPAAPIARPADAGADAATAPDARTPGTGEPDASAPGDADANAPTEGGNAPAKVADIAAGFAHTCVRLETNAVRCWGAGTYGQLGYANGNSIGDLATPASVGAGDVNVGGAVAELALGDDHTCARTASGGVRCWGRSEHGRLGYGNVNDIGLLAAPAAAGDVNVGGPALGLAAAWSHTCARMAGGAVRCWGFGRHGKLGYGNTRDIGDDEAAGAGGDVNVGGAVVQVAAGDDHTCAVLDTGAVRCWGRGEYGQLGYGNTRDIGDDETPASAGDVNVGGPVAQIAAGYAHTCALLRSGAVRCWGAGGSGQLGYGNAVTIGDDEAPASAGDVNVGGPVTQIVAGYVHTCALLSAGTVRCWGQGNTGQLGYGSVFPVGDDKTPAGVGDVSVGGRVVKLAAGYAHTCALLSTGAVRCWGFGASGQLGYGNTRSIGDDELPSSAGDVPLF